MKSGWLAGDKFVVKERSLPTLTSVKYRQRAPHVCGGKRM